MIHLKQDLSLKQSDPLVPHSLRRAWWDRRGPPLRNSLLPEGTRGGFGKAAWGPCVLQTQILCSCPQFMEKQACN